MAAKGAAPSAPGLTFLQRSARLYEGERWWLLDGGGEVRGLLLFDGGDDLACLRDHIGRQTTGGYCFRLDGNEVAMQTPQLSSSRLDVARRDCQVTVEERIQLFGFLKKGTVKSSRDKG